MDGVLEAGVEFFLLGPLLVRRGGQVVPIAAAKQRVVLAVLLLKNGRAASLEELGEALWGPVPPASARATLQNYVRRLRSALGDEAGALIVTRPGGYLIRVDPGDVDVSRFEALQRGAGQAARRGGWDQAEVMLREALSLWREAPLADVPSDLLARREGPRLAEMHLQALESRIEADLQLGRHGEVIAELRQLVAEYPLREHLHAMVMLALCRDGRQGDALAAYQQAREVLVGELGLEPGQQLRELHQRILAGDPELALPLSTRGDGAGPVVPRQLPAVPRHFTGRHAELATLSALLGELAGARVAAGGDGTVIISAIGGMGGVGKTSLALQFAHQVAGQFGDGQLYVNLRGFGPVGPPVEPAEAVHGFLEALAVPRERIPVSAQAQAGLYRSLLAGKQMLIVLDNARDADQVRPLLPAGPGCLVLVTSRSQLAGLVADGASLLTLDVLTAGEARDLLTLHLGPGRISGDDAAAAELIQLCARLPLALSVAAARAAAHPSFPLAALAAELRDTRGRLDAFDVGELASNVRAVFSWSYGNLSEDAARMFRLLGVHPGPAFTAPAAASLAAIPLRHTRRILSELAGACLLTEHTPGRYGCHDLLRAYAAEQASTIDSGRRRRAAIGRVLDHYLHTADAADRLLYPARRLVNLAAPRPGVTLDVITSREQALTWFGTEHRVLLAAIALAVQGGFDTHAWQLPWTMETFFYRRGHWHDWAAASQTALAAARRLGDRYAQVQARRGIASAQIELGDLDDAIACLAQALRLCEETGDIAGIALIHLDLARAFEDKHHYQQALAHGRDALRLAEATGDRGLQARALNQVGWDLARLGSYQEALPHCERALALNLELGDKHAEPSALDSLAYVHSHLGHHAKAADCYRRAVELHAELGSRHQKAKTLTWAGDAHCAAGDLPAAHDAWTQALAILDELHHPDAGKARAKLATLAGTGAGPGG